MFLVLYQGDISLFSGEELILLSNSEIQTVAGEC